MEQIENGEKIALCGKDFELEGGFSEVDLFSGKAIWCAPAVVDLLAALEVSGGQNEADLWLEGEDMLPLLVADEHLHSMVVEEATVVVRLILFHKLEREHPEHVVELDGHSIPCRSDEMIVEHVVPDQVVIPHDGGVVVVLRKLIIWPHVMAEAALLEWMNHVCIIFFESDVLEIDSEEPALELQGHQLS
jgi:hypothetical protein